MEVIGRSCGALVLHDGLIAIAFAASNPIMVGNLLVCCSEAPDGQAIAVDAVMRSLVALINAGALTAA